MQPHPNPRRRLVLSHSEHTPGRLDLGPGAPARDEGTREHGIREVDRNSVIEHAADAGRGHRPAIGGAVPIEPGGDLTVSRPRPPGGTPILIRTGKRRSAAVIMS